MIPRPIHFLWRLFGAVLLLAGPVASAEDSTAPGFALSHFEPSGSGSRFFTLESLDWRAGTGPTFGVVGDYAHKPLVIYALTPQRRQEIRVIARDFALAHVGGAYAFGDRFRVGLDLPVLGYGNGAVGRIGLVTYPAPQHTGMGDLRVRGDWRFVGSAHDAVRAGLGVSLFLPTGDPAAFMGDGVLRGALQLQAAGEVADYLAWSARAGVLLSGLDAEYAGAQLGHQAQAAVGVGLRAFSDRLIAGPELSVTTSLKGAFSEPSTSIDLMIGAHYAISPQWRVGAGIGRGFTSAVGSPSLRGVVGVEWTPVFSDPNACNDLRASLASARAAAEEQAALAAAARVEAERAARERAAAERRAAEAAERQRLALEQAAAEARANADDDGDGVRNADDACPAEAGAANAERSKNGCPTGAVVGEQLVLDQVRFRTASDVLLPESQLILEKVLAAISKLPADYRYRIEGHTDDRGPASFNKDLSERRAKSVAKWLVAHGFDGSRLESAGFGPERPVAPNDSDENRQRNRRVEIHIVNLEAR
ncbi:MAG: OmpA family protein [Myxococcaceae bacterium]|nr:OmpA family protein [Myxococcaceae bacterium]